MKPQRIQRKRVKGYRMPAGAIYVGRPSKFQNSYKIGAIYKTAQGPITITRENCLGLFRSELREYMKLNPEWLDPLRNVEFLACWCNLDLPCHIDVILEVMDEPKFDALCAECNSPFCLHREWAGGNPCFTAGELAGLIQHAFKVSNA